MTRFQLSMRAENLSRGIFRRPDPYAVVRVGKSEHNGAEIGRTEVLPSTTDPDWVRILFIEADAAKITFVTVSVYDNNGRGDNRDDESRMLGQATFEVTEVNQSPGHFQEHALDARRAKLFLSATVSESSGAQRNGGGGSGSTSVTLHFRGLDIRNVEPGLLGLGRSDPFFEISKKNSDHNAGIVRWNAVYRSESIDNHLNPFWKEFSIGMHELCDDDVHSPLLITVFDLDKRKHQEIGKFETTLAQLKERVAVKGNADREKAFPIMVEDGDSHGLICVLKVEFNTVSEVHV